MSRHVFTYLRSFRYRASTFARPPHSPSFLVLSFFSSAPASSSFLLLRLRFFLFHLQLLHLPPAETRRAALSSFLFFFLPALLPLIPHDQTTTTATNNHLVPLRCRERRCRCARRLIFGRTFRFGVLYWTVQKWHLPVSELTSCQVSVSFARAVPGRRRVYASACIYVPLACVLRVRVHVYACRAADPPLSPLYTRLYLASLSLARVLSITAIRV